MIIFLFCLFFVFLQFIQEKVFPLFYTFGSVDLVVREHHRRNENIGTLYIENYSSMDVSCIQRIHLENFNINVASQSRCATIKNQWMLRTMQMESKFAIMFYKYNELVNCFAEVKYKIITNETRNDPGIVYHQGKIYLFGGCTERDHVLKNVST